MEKQQNFSIKTSATDDSNSNSKSEKTNSEKSNCNLTRYRLRRRARGIAKITDLGLGKSSLSKSRFVFTHFSSIYYVEVSTLVGDKSRFCHQIGWFLYALMYAFITLVHGLLKSLGVNAIIISLLSVILIHMLCTWRSIFELGSMRLILFKSCLILLRKVWNSIDWSAVTLCTQLSHKMPATGWL